MKGILNLYLSVGPELSSIGIVTGLIQMGVVCSHCGNEFNMELNRCDTCGGILFGGVYERATFYAELRGPKIDGVEYLYQEYDEFFPKHNDFHVSGKSDIIRLRIWMQKWLDLFTGYQLQVIFDTDRKQLEQFNRLWPDIIPNNKLIGSNGQSFDIRTIYNQIPFDFNVLLVLLFKKTPIEVSIISRKWLYHNRTPKEDVMLVFGKDFIDDEKPLTELEKAQRLQMNFVKYGGDALWDTNC